MKILIAALMILLIQPAFSLNPIEETAILALKAAKSSPTGKLYEHGGMIFQRDGGEAGPLIEYMEPVPNGTIVGVRAVNLDLLLPSDKLLGTYHLHLCLKGYYHNLFSIQDVIVAFVSGVPEFMLDECTGDIHEFDANIDKVHDTGIDATLFGINCEAVKKHLPSGRIIGNIGETEEPRIVLDEEQVCHN